MVTETRDREKLYRETIFKALKYRPTEAQVAIFEDEHRVELVAGGWRAGKSHTGAKKAVLKVPRSQLIWLGGKTYNTSRTEFEYVMADLLRLGLITSGKVPTNKEGPLVARAINGCVIETKSADDPQKIGQVAPDFILLCEAAQLDYDSFLRFRGRLLERDGQMTMTGTFEDSFGWYPEYFNRGQGVDPELKSFSLPSWSNTVVFPGGRQDPKILSLEVELSPDLFKQYCEAIPCPPSGLITPEFDNRIHVGDYPYDPVIPVEIAVDPGYGGAYAVEAVQIKESQPYLVDEIYEQGKTTEDIVKDIKRKPWGSKIRAGAIDVAGKQHQAMAAPIEVFQEKMGLYLDSRWVDVEGGIELLRNFLSVNPLTGKPRMYVDSKCRGFISECGGGKSPLQGGGAWCRNVDTGVIVDKNNHATKAFIHWLVSRYGYAATRDNNDYGKLYDFSKIKRSGIREEWLKRIKAR